MTRRRSIAAAVAAIAAAFSLAGCAGATPPARPDPAAVVTEYLAALADGDSATASALDAVARDGAPFTQSSGSGFLETDALSSAVERITVGSITVSTSGAAAAAVVAEFSLAGEDFAPVLRLRWDDSDERWVLRDSLANLLLVQAVGPDALAGPVTYTLGGAAPTGSFDDVDAPVAAVYPGIYDLTIDIDPAELADPTMPLARQLVIDPYLQGPQDGVLAPSVDIAVR